MSLLSLSNLIVTNDAYALAKNGLRSQVALNITTASVNAPNDTDVVPLAMSLQEKIETYDLAAIETSGLIFSDTLEFTDWDEITGEEFTVYVTVNASGQITYVNDGAHSVFGKRKVQSLAMSDIHGYVVEIHNYARFDMEPLQA
ncbi:hypothetical protein [Brevibacillus brevis]|uniref:hypothetical protein n=1 Tax=Brevibacillus brevis TaxID=1393 RepID=UPI0037C4FC3F